MGEENRIKIGDADLRELGSEDFRKIVEDVEKRGSWESRFILVLETNNRPGAMFTDYTRYEIVYGDAEEIELDSWYNYPHSSGVKSLIIPKTIPVIVRYWHRDNLSGGWREWEEIHVFTKDGWKRLKIK